MIFTFIKDQVDTEAMAVDECIIYLTYCNFLLCRYLLSTDHNTDLVIYSQQMSSFTATGSTIFHGLLVNFSGNEKSGLIYKLITKYFVYVKILLIFQYTQVEKIGDGLFMVVVYKYPLYYMISLFGSQVKGMFNNVVHFAVFCPSHNTTALGAASFIQHRRFRTIQHLVRHVNCLPICILRRCLCHTYKQRDWSNVNFNLTTSII